MSKEKIIFRDFHMVDSEIRLPLIDRIRLIFGSKLFFQMHIGTQWKGEVQTRSNVAVEKVFAKRYKPQPTVSSVE